MQQRKKEIAIGASSGIGQRSTNAVSVLMGISTYIDQRKRRNQNDIHQKRPLFLIFPQITGLFFLLFFIPLQPYDSSRHESP